MGDVRPEGQQDVSVLRASGLGRWSIEPGSYSVAVDDVLSDMLGVPGAGTYPVEDLLLAVHPEDRTSVFATLEAVSLRCQVAAAGQESLDRIRVLEEFRLQRADSTTQWVRLRGGVVLGEDGVRRITGVAADTTALRTSRERTGRTLAQVSDGVLILEPDWTIAYVNDSAARLLERKADDLLGRPFWEEFPESLDNPVSVNFRWSMDNQRPVTFETPTASTGWLAVRTFPSVDGLTVYLRSVEAHHEAERERVRLIQRLERALARGRQLLALTKSLSTTLTVTEVADAVTANARRSLGTIFAGVALVDESEHRLHYVSMSPLPTETAAVWSHVPLSRSAPVSDTARLGRPFFHENVEQAVADFPDIGSHMLAAGTQALAHLPLLAGSGAVLGTLALSWGPSHPMSDEERGFLVTVAGHTAQAIERALLFEQHQTVADALQRAVLPDLLPTVPGMSLAATYVPAGGQLGGGVGGDWYDAFVLPYGRLGVAIGDAAGHGLPAARVMSVLRNALRAYAMLGGGPGSVVTHLDRLVARLEPDAFATLAYLELDPATGDGAWAAAGHPPMLQVTTDGSAAFLPGDPDPPIGSLGPAGARHHRFRLEPGDALVLYTDGLVERRDVDLGSGLEALRAAVERARTESAPALVDDVTTRLLGGRGPSDDVCLVAVQRDMVISAGPSIESHQPGPRQAPIRWTLRAVPTAAFEARTAAREALRTWHLEELTDTLTLVVSELVTNAVTHARSDVALELCLLDDAVRVAVSDSSHRSPEHQDPGPREEHGRGVHLVDVLAARWGTERHPWGKRVWAELDLP
ncbi:MAG: SpoIIE family protein phosphatase [Kineosporiaceae bacterium]